MSGHNETVRILNTEAEQQLAKQRDAELYKVRKLKLVLLQLRRLPIAAFSGEIDKVDQVERGLQIVNVSNYLHLSNGKEHDYLLDLRSCCSVNLSYTERKAVRRQIIKNLQTNLKPVADFSRKLRAELPEMFLTAAPLQNTSGSVDLMRTASAEILALEKERRKNLEKLLTQRNRKCAYLKAAAELKMGPYLGHEVELLYAQARMNQIKTNVLHAYFVHSLVSRSEHSLKAIKEVEGYIDKVLEQEKVEE